MVALGRKQMAPTARLAALQAVVVAPVALAAVRPGLQVLLGRHQRFPPQEPQTPTLAAAAADRLSTAVAATVATALQLPHRPAQTPQATAAAVAAVALALRQATAGTALVGGF
jgi:hypothetical protein